MKWYKMFSTDVLADKRIGQLRFNEVGVLFMAWNLLRSQTDEPGKFITAGKPWTKDDIVHAIRHTCATDETRMSYICAWYEKLHQVGLLATDEQGVHYCPRIVAEYKESIANTIGGKASQAISVERVDEQSGERTVEPRIRIRERIRNSAEREPEPIFPKKVEAKSRYYLPGRMPSLEEQYKKITWPEPLPAKKEMP